MTEDQRIIQAAADGDVQALRALLEAGADVNSAGSDSMTPLIRAAFAGHTEATQLLLSYGADVAARDRLGSTAMDWALAKGHDEVVDALRGVGSVAFPPNGTPIEHEAFAPPAEEAVFQEPSATEEVITAATTEDAVTTAPPERSPEAPIVFAEDAVSAQMTEATDERVFGRPTPATEVTQPEAEVETERLAETDSAPHVGEAAATAVAAAVTSPPPSPRRDEPQHIEHRERRSANQSVAPKRRMVTPSAHPPIAPLTPIVESNLSPDNNPLHIAITALVIFLISGAVVYAITAGIGRSATPDDEQSQRAVVAPQPTVVPGDVATDAPQRPTAAAPIAESVGDSRSNEAATPRDAAASEAPAKDTKAAAKSSGTTREERAAPTRDSARDKREASASTKQNRARPSAVPAPTPRLPASKKKVIQWP